MSTRSATIVRQKTYHGKDEYTTDELFRFYRHCDGYPEGHGMQMAQAFANCMENDMPDPDDSFGWMRVGTLNNRNWVQHCFKRLFAMPCDLEVEPLGTEHGDLDYIYVVEGAYDAYGGKHAVDDLPVTIAVYRVGWDDCYSSAMAKEPRFKGTPADYIDWVEGM